MCEIKFYRTAWPHLPEAWAEDPGRRTLQRNEIRPGGKLLVSGWQ
jgi:hypothetical protein